jgi:outer membrane putative beta-barrel porin/alpha-amylase
MRHYYRAIWLYCLLAVLPIRGSIAADVIVSGFEQQAEINGRGKDGEDDGGIEDNSFLIEEAYNQEPGIVQHIFNWVRGWDWTEGHSRTFDFVFTQEWPIGSQTHQFSYTVPISTFSEHPDGGPSSEEEGFGDILLNYRLQLLKETESQVAFAPRSSVILPTGDEDEGLGTGEVGYQINLPLSKKVGQWAFHANAGLTVIPDVKAGVDPALSFDGRTLNGYNLGASAIWLARPSVNFKLEALAVWDEELTETGSKDHTFEMLLSPGIRWAPYTSGDTQWVLGIGLPIGVSRDARDISLFFYMSFEHPFNPR